MLKLVLCYILHCQVGNHIDIMTGDWTAIESGIGGNIDSYYEYLLKGGILFNRRSLLHQFEGELLLCVIAFMQALEKKALSECTYAVKF